MKYCTACGTKLEDSALFCSECGTRQGAPSADAAPAAEQPKQETIFGALTGAVNRMTGGKKEAVRPPLRKLFGQILKSHTKEEAEAIFACGTPAADSRLTSAETAWPQPWLWSRIMVGFGIAFVLMSLCCSLFDNANAYPGAMLFGSFMMPVAAMIFCFELNTPRNISFYTLLKVFMVGGAASLLLTCLLYEIVDVGELDVWGACLVSLVEETAKVAIVAYYLYREKDAKYYVNGLLLGAAVGAGFGALESAGYAFRVLLSSGLNFDIMMDVIWLRAYLAPGMHTAWAAITGYAVMLALQGENFSVNFLGKVSFWKVAIISLVLHAVWDMPIDLGTEIPLVQIILTILAWVVIFVLIGNCLTQLAEQVKKEEAEAAPQAPQEAETAVTAE